MSFKRKYAACSAEGRLAQFPGQLYVSEGVLFCEACRISLAAGKKDTLVDHFKSQKHQQSLSKPVPPARQIALPNTRTLEVRQDFVLDFVRMMASANIPIERAPLMAPFLIKHCANGGALPQASALRARYLPKVFEDHLQALKQALAGKEVFVVIDETTDDRDWAVVNILLDSGPNLFLVDVVKVDRMDNQDIGQIDISNARTCPRQMSGQLWT